MKIKLLSILILGILLTAIAQASNNTSVNLGYTSYTSGINWSSLISPNYGINWSEIITSNVSANSFNSSATNTPQVNLYPQYPADTHWVVCVNGDGGADNDDPIVISEGTTCGSSNRITVSPGGLVTIPSAAITGTLNPTTNGINWNAINNIGASENVNWNIIGDSIGRALIRTSTGVNWSDIGSGGGSGTVTSIATTAPITGGTITSSGTIAITQATTSTNGYLSSTDWNTFNSKGTGTVNSGTAGYFAYYPSTATTVDDAPVFYTDGTNAGFGTVPTTLTASGLTATHLEIANNTSTSLVGLAVTSTTGGSTLRVVSDTNAKTPNINLGDNNTGSYVDKGSLYLERTSNITSGATRNDLVLTTSSASTDDLILATAGTARMQITSTGSIYNFGPANGTQFYNTIYNNGSSGTSKTIDWSNGTIQKLTLTGNCTLTWSNRVNGNKLILEVIQGSGPYTLTYPGTVSWPSGTAPTLTTTNGKKDIITFFYDGTNEYGQTYGQNY